MMFLVHVFKETVHPKMKCKRITYPHVGTLISTFMREFLMSDL